MHELIVTGHPVAFHIHYIPLRLLWPKSSSPKRFSVMTFTSANPSVNIMSSVGRGYKAVCVTGARDVWQAGMNCKQKRHVLLKR